MSTCVNGNPCGIDAVHPLNGVSPNLGQEVAIIPRAVTLVNSIKECGINCITGRSRFAQEDQAQSIQSLPQAALTPELFSQLGRGRSVDASNGMRDGCLKGL
jgi:hypothetical protein